jgi:hypothetical protein
MERIGEVAALGGTLVLRKEPSHAAFGVAFVAPL